MTRWQRLAQYKIDRLHTKTWIGSKRRTYISLHRIMTDRRTVINLGKYGRKRDW